MSCVATLRSWNLNGFRWNATSQDYTISELGFGLKQQLKNGITVLLLFLMVSTLLYYLIQNSFK
jgi:hypothetical protein